MPRQFARGRARKPVAHRLAMQKPLRGSAIEDGTVNLFADAAAGPLVHE
jgi:hypothetical protein